LIDLKPPQPPSKKWIQRDGLDLIPLKEAAQRAQAPVRTLRLAIARLREINGAPILGMKISGADYVEAQSLLRLERRFIRIPEDQPLEAPVDLSKLTLLQKVAHDFNARKVVRHKRVSTWDLKSLVVGRKRNLNREGAISAIYDPLTEKTFLTQEGVEAAEFLAQQGFISL
jgi:hypothetical protein